MAMFDIFDVAGSALSAQSIRLNATASNLANANNVSGDEASVYRSRQPVFTTHSFSDTLDRMGGSFGWLNNKATGESVGVRVLGIVNSSSPVATRFQPDHPLANEDGFVFASNVNPVEEMTNMISASRSYQSNIEVINTTKELFMRTLGMGR